MNFVHVAWFQFLDCGLVPFYLSHPLSLSLSLSLHLVALMHRMLLSVSVSDSAPLLTFPLLAYHT